MHVSIRTATSSFPTIEVFEGVVLAMDNLTNDLPGICDSVELVRLTETPDREIWVEVVIVNQSANETLIKFAEKCGRGAATDAVAAAIESLVGSLMHRPPNMVQ